MKVKNFNQIASCHITFADALQLHNQIQDQAYWLALQQQAKHDFNQALNNYQASLAQQALQHDEKKQLILEYTVSQFANTPRALSLSQQLKHLCLEFIRCFDHVDKLAKIHGKKFKVFSSFKLSSMLSLLHQSLQPLEKIVVEMSAEFTFFSGETDYGNDTLLPVCVEVLKRAQVDAAILAEFSQKLCIDFYDLSERLQKLSDSTASLTNSRGYACALNLASAAQTLLNESHHRLFDDNSEEEWSVVLNPERNPSP